MQDWAVMLFFINMLEPKLFTNPTDWNTGCGEQRSNNLKWKPTALNHKTWSKHEATRRRCSKILYEHFLPIKSNKHGIYLKLERGDSILIQNLLRFEIVTMEKMGTSLKSKIENHFCILSFDELHFSFELISFFFYTSSFCK